MELDRRHFYRYVFVMKFEWDEQKNLKNYAKHEISFELACKVFDDPLTIYVFDKIVDNEERWHAIGRVQDLPLLIVVHTYRDTKDGESIRIISARQASSQERRHYEEE
jgi:uncharacterized DUF497 family protein